MFVISMDWTLFFKVSGMLLYVCFDMVCYRAVVVLDAALNPHQLLLWMSLQKG